MMLIGGWCFVSSSMHVAWICSPAFGSAVCHYAICCFSPPSGLLSHPRKCSQFLITSPFFFIHSSVIPLVLLTSFSLFLSLPFPFPFPSPPLTSNSVILFL
ncbi:hypothetical protein BJ912DRAFT_968012 [Pholiota molesta]|nr:hypothetical protein BJ912DRAFT_968012 [Pholiota molesta]